MSIVSAHAAQSLAGLANAERIEARDKAKAPPARPPGPRRRDDSDEVIVDTQTVDAVRDLKDNSQEEAHEDRQQQAHYRPDGTVATAGRRALDIEG